MATTAIPCTPNGQSEWTQRTQLSGVEYLLTFRWSQRVGQWSLSIADANAVPLYTGIPLTVGTRMLPYYAGVRVIPGVMVVADTSVDGLTGDLDPGFDDLGDRFQLLYYTRD